MAKVTITLDTGNAAFEDDPRGEPARILRELASRISDYGLANCEGLYLFDLNGNRVGSVTVNGKN